MSKYATLSSMTTEKLIDQLKRIRQEAGVSQKEMADAIGVSRQGYSHLESAVRAMKLNRAEAAFKVLGYVLEAVPLPLDDDRLVPDSAPPAETMKERFALLQLLYRKSVTGKHMAFHILARCLTELSDAERDALNHITEAYLDAPAMREAMLASCVAMAERYRQ